MCFVMAHDDNPLFDVKWEQTSVSHWKSFKNELDDGFMKTQLVPALNSRF